VLYPLSYGGSGTKTLAAGGFRPPVCGCRVSLAAMVERRVRVLVVDDSEVIRTLITVNLELEGFEVHQAVDGQDALDRIHEIAPDVMTIDVVMPRLDGFTTVARLRADPRTCDLKIAMVSASAQDADLAKGQRVGVDAYVTKPFDPDSLVRTVRELVERQAG
jgi:CheY-like chemotaxis protein